MSLKDGWYCIVVCNARVVMCLRFNAVALSMCFVLCLANMSRGDNGVTNHIASASHSCEAISIKGDAAASLPTAEFPPYDCRFFIEGVNFRSTGAFRTEQDSKGRWWLVDPLGRGFVSFGIQGVNWHGCYDLINNRYAYQEANIRRFGTREKWAEDAIRKHKDWGFNTLGFLRSSKLLDHRGLPCIRSFSLGMCKPEMPEEYWISVASRPVGGVAFPNVFHPHFAEICALAAKRMCAPYKDDPWTIGYYLDNELAWYRGRTVPGVPAPFALFEVCMRKKSGHSARIAAENWVRAHGVDPAGVIPDEVKRGFLIEIARRYFKTLSQAIRSADSNHLIMGCRFAGVAGAGDDEVWNIAGEYCDVVTFNCYPMVDIERNTVAPGEHDSRSCREVFDALYARTKKPMMITEWSFPALDSGLPCRYGAGQRFNTQTERTHASELWMRTLLSMPYIVGWAVLRWVDQPGGGASGNGEDCNYGLLNEAGEPYPCVDAFARVQKNAKRFMFNPPPPVQNIPPVSTRIVEEMLSKIPRLRNAKVKFSHSDGKFRVTNGELMVEGRIGGRTILSHVAFKGRTIGKWNFMISHHSADNRFWTSVSRVTAVEWKRDINGSGRLIVTGEAEGNGIAYHVKKSFIFKPGIPVFRVELLEVKNTGVNPISLEKCYFVPSATFAGEVKVSSVTSVRNLWRAPKVAAWFAKDGRYWGAATDTERVGSINFYVDDKGRVHSDFAILPFNGGRQGDTVILSGVSYTPTSEERMRVWALMGLGGIDEWCHITNQPLIR